MGLGGSEAVCISIPAITLNPPSNVNAAATGRAAQAMRASSSAWASLRVSAEKQKRPFR